MLTDPKVVLPDDPVPKAVDLMIEHGIRNLPVASADGRFLGSFSTVRLIEMLLPKVATFKGESFGAVTNLAFLRDSFDDIRDRLYQVRRRRVGDFMDVNVPTIGPNSSEVEGMLLLYKHRTHVPVVEPKSGRLVGVVSFRCILQAITGH